MSPRGYLTFKAIVNPSGGKDSLKRFLDSKSQAYSPEERILFLHVHFDRDTIHDFLLDVECRDYPSDDKPHRRLDEVHARAFPRYCEYIASNIIGRNLSVPFSSPENVIPRIKCPVFGIRLPQEPLRAKDLGVRIQFLVPRHHPEVPKYLRDRIRTKPRVTISEGNAYIGTLWNTVALVNVLLRGCMREVYTKN